METSAKKLGSAPGWIKIIADAVAVDYFEATGTKPEVMLGGTGSRSGAEPVPGHFIRTTVFCYGWEKFYRRDDAEKWMDLMRRSTTGRKVVFAKVKEQAHDMGILETIAMLEDQFKSPLTHTLEKFRILSTSESFGL